ncbi:MAG: hypothetical protein QM762_14475 [Chryseolinea sp.]
MHFFTVRHTNWDSLYSAYRPTVNKYTPFLIRLKSVLIELLGRLDDSHVALYGPDDSWTYTSGFAVGTIALRDEFSLNLIKNNYLDSFAKVQGENDLSFGKIPEQEYRLYLPERREWPRSRGSYSSCSQATWRARRNHPRLTYKLRR